MTTTPVVRGRRGRKPKIADGRKKANVMLPVWAHQRFETETLAMEVPLTDMGAYYMILGWNESHPSNQIPMPPYLQDAVERARQSIEIQEPLLQAS